MCGIVGIVGAHQPVEPDLVVAMRDRLAHRGPDDAGVAFSRDGTTAFGHRRLAIIDPSPGGHQPMANPTGTLLLTYNGEIYNFRQIRARLEEHGVRFRTRSDAEVLLKAFEHRGLEAVDWLRGMFAFAVWNEETQACVLARDRLGIKPLYYALLDGTLYFASEATALLAAPGFRREIDDAALGDYLTYGYVPAPRSIWRHIAKLPPGHQLVFQGARARLVRYWQPTASEAGDPGAAAFARLLGGAVQCHTVSDVPVGSFLSGGLDSATVTALMAQAAPQPIRTFTIDFSGTARSEARYARLVAERYGTRHHEQRVEARPDLDTLLDIARIYDEPLADESALPTALMAEAVARQLKVVLSGDGGDETLAGYAWYGKAVRLEAARRRLGRLAPPLATLGGWLCGGRGGPAAGWRLAHRLSLLGGASLENYARLVGFLGADERARLLAPALARNFDDDALWALRRYWRPELPLVRRLQILDMQTFLPDDILLKVDRAAMHHSLEVRVPFLDHQVVETALSLPVGAVHRNGRGKQILREAALPLVPAPIIDRPKQGFGLPRREWERHGLGRVIAARLRDGQLRRRGWLVATALEALLGDRRGRRPNQLWSLFVLDLWLEAHAVA